VPDVRLLDLARDPQPETGERVLDPAARLGEERGVFPAAGQR